MSTSDLATIDPAALADVSGGTASVATTSSSTDPNQQLMTMLGSITSSLQNLGQNNNGNSLQQLLPLLLLMRGGLGGGGGCTSAACCAAGAVGAASPIGQPGAIPISGGWR